jgi:hypothetical protein
LQKLLHSKFLLEKHWFQLLFPNYP